TKASAAFMTRLLAQAIPRKDGHIITQIKKECPGSGDTQPCLAALKSFVGDSTTTPTEETLAEAVWINGDCQGGYSEPIQNKYCTQAHEEAKRQSIALKCLLSVKGILELMGYAPEISEKDVPFIEQAVDLYTKELRKKESIVVEHHVKGDEWDWGMARLSDFGELRNALNSFGLVLARVCLKVKDSEPCKKFVGYFVQLLLKNDLLNAVLFLQKKVPSGALTESYLIDAVDKLANEGHWGKAAKIITALPNSPATQKAIEKTVDLALSNLSGTEEVLKLYQVAKTWITPSEIKNEKQLMRMIEALLNNNTSSLREMAAVLVTKLIQRKSSDPIDYSINASEIDRQEDLPRGARGLSFSSTGHETNVYELKKPPLDSYYSGIYGTSWKEKLRAVGYTIE
ncbi:MAG TPA: hypothetical protein VLE95_02025, partial [Chlamydiales bacterium]|nr:hypothetical protein [Chlamydiales bacterium]